MRAVSPAGVKVNLKLVIEPTPGDHFTTGPHCRVIGSSQGGVRGAGRHPTVRPGIVSPACVKIDHRAAKNPSPNNHFRAGPHRRVRVSRRRCIVQARGNPTVRARIVSAASVAIVKHFIHAAPDDHFTTGPHRCVVDPAWGYIDKPSGCPTVGAGIISAAGVQSVHRIASAPDNHFAPCPLCGVLPSCGRRIHGARRCPSVSGGIVSSTSIQVTVKAASKSAPDDHLAAGPDRRVLSSCGGCISGAGRCPAITYRIVSAACVQQVRAVESAPDNDLAASPYRALTASSLRCVGGAGRCPTV